MIDLRDHNERHAFEQRMKIAAGVRDMGPGSGIAMRGPDGRMVGDPEIVRRAGEAEAIQARMAAEAQARSDAMAIRFAGPYDNRKSVQ